MEWDEDTRPVRERIRGEAKVLGCRGSDVRATGRGFLDFPGLQAADTDINAAHRSVQKEDFHLLDIREKAAARNAGDLFTDTAGLFCETAANDRIARQRLLVADRTFSHRAVIIVRRCFLASCFF